LPFEALRQEPRERVGPAAGGVRHHDAHGFRRIVLDRGALAGGGAEDGKTNDGKTKGAGDGALEDRPGPMRHHRIAVCPSEWVQPFTRTGPEPCGRSPSLMMPRRLATSV
jgi:hypothetical protein